MYLHMDKIIVGPILFINHLDNNGNGGAFIYYEYIGRVYMGLIMNVKKTKTIVISREENHSADILVNNTMLEQINSFTYLG